MLRAFGSPPLFAEFIGTATPTVVALHGWGRDRGDFSVALEGLDAAVVDLAGFGASPPPPSAWGSADYAEQVLALLDDLSEPVVLVGHSFGGRVAVRIAAAHPERVRALVLTGAPIARRPQTPRRKPRTAFRLLRLAHRFGLVSAEAMERGRRRYGSADYAAAQGVMREVLVTVLQEDYEDDLARIDVPVTLLWGASDADVPLAVAERARDLLPHGELVVEEGVGHDLPWRAPQALRRAIDATVQR